MSGHGLNTGLNAAITPQRLKFFTHKILTALAKSSPIWGYPAVIAGDNYPFVNQRTGKVPTIFLDIEVENNLGGAIRVLGTLLSEAIRIHSEPEDNELGTQLITMNNGHGRFSLVIQALSAKDPFQLVEMLTLKRYHILHSAFEIIDHVYDVATPDSRPRVYQ